MVRLPFSISFRHHDALLLELSQIRMNCITFGLDTFLIGTQLRQCTVKTFSLLGFVLHVLLFLRLLNLILLRLSVECDSGTLLCCGDSPQDFLKNQTQLPVERRGPTMVAQHSFSSPMNNKTMDRLNAGAEKVHKSTVPWREPCDVGEPPRRRGCTVCKSPSSSSRRVKSGIHDPRAPARVCTRCDAAQGGRLHRAGRQRPHTADSLTCRLRCCASCPACSGPSPRRPGTCRPKR